MVGGGEFVWTMAIGYDKPLYVLPFDDRATFWKEMFGWQEPLSPEQATEIAGVKRVIFDGLRAAVADGVPKDRAGVLVDEEFGAAILHDARKQGLITALGARYPWSAEKSGDPDPSPRVGAPGAPEFEFEYASDYARHIEQFDPTFCKVPVRYNPGGDKATNRRQASRLRQFSDYLHASGRMFMFELLVPPNPAQLQRLGNDKNAYDVQLRPTLTVQAIHELQDSGVEADVWKIEGFQRKEDCQRVVAAAHRVGRDTVGCIISGRHEDAGTMYPWLTDCSAAAVGPTAREAPRPAEQARQWLLVAAGVPGYIGFAVGRTTFWDPLVRLPRPQDHARHRR